MKNQQASQPTAKAQFFLESFGPAHFSLRTIFFLWRIRWQTSKRSA
jgi:hypothetical protein